MKDFVQCIPFTVEQISPVARLELDRWIKRPALNPQRYRGSVNIMKSHKVHDLLVWARLFKTNDVVVNVLLKFQTLISEIHHISVFGYKVIKKLYEMTSKRAR